MNFYYFWMKVTDHYMIKLYRCCSFGFLFQSIYPFRYEFLCEHILIFTEGLDFGVSSFGC